MGENQVAFENNIKAATTNFDIIIEWLLGGLLIFMPFAFGVVHAWSEEIVCVLSGAILICFLLKILHYRNEGIIWTWAYVPIGVFLLIAAIQLLPLPAGLIRIISPNTVALRTELLAGLPNAETLPKSMPLSFYPYATKHDIRLVLSIAAVFVVVLNVFRRPEQIKRLLMTIALIGGAVAVITLALQLFGNGKIYWLIASENTKGYSGPFVCHSHYGQFMNLSIGAALGWICVKLHEDFSGKQIKPNTVMDYLSSHSARSLWLLIIIMIIGVATVFASLTRGGMVGLLIAAVFTTLLLACRKPLAGRGWIMVVVALAAFACILYVGFDAVYDRFATLRDLNAYEGRLQILKDLAVSFGQFPILGTGLGTHSVVYPMFQTINTALLFTHAENEYAHALEETGIVGLVTLIFFAICVWASYAKHIRPTPNRCGTSWPIRSAAYGMGFGLLAILIHSLSDFGQHLPANAFLSAIFCALLVGLAGQRRGKTPIPKAITPAPKFRYLHTAVFCGACGIGLWVFIGANNARIAQAHWKKAIAIEKALSDKDRHPSRDEYADLISHTAIASGYQPENVKYRYWLNAYRWYSISKTGNSDTKNTTILEASMPLVRDIVSELNKATVFCPTYGPVYSLVGQLEKFIFNDDAGAEKIRKGFRLAPCDPIVCFVAGRLDMLEGKIESCVQKFEKAVEIEGTLFKDVVNIYINHLSRPHLAISAAGNDIGRLQFVVNALEDMQYKDLAEQTTEKLKVLLETKCSQPDASAGYFVLLADIYRKQHANEKAIEYYQRALEFDYGRVYWRFALAKLLAETDEIPQALHEARICVRLRPQFKAAKNLVAELSVNPASF